MPTIAVSMERRVEALGRLLSRVEPVPGIWIEETPVDTDRLTCTHCESYESLRAAWENAMHWTDGLDTALVVMLASILSTKVVGDQLWIKILGPASSGKSTLCEAVSVNHKYILAKSTIRGFHSGFGGKESDNSLIERVRDKTLVIKDGDTLLQSPNLPQVLSEGRDIYDGTSRSHYRNAKGKDYSGVRMTWILCGTNSLRSLDQSELGERFLDCVIMDSIDDELEDRVIFGAVRKHVSTMNSEADGFAETHYDPETVEAYCKTGGYVGYLRDNAVSLLKQVTVSQLAMYRCGRLGKFVAFMRARPSIRQDETSEREFGARLAIQHVRLAKCMSVVLNKRSVDAEVMRRVSKVAMDTASGATLEIVRCLYEEIDGLESRALAVRTGRTDDEIRKMLRFLRKIRVLENNQIKSDTGASTLRNNWTLTAKIRKLCSEVL